MGGEKASKRGSLVAYGACLPCFAAVLAALHKALDLPGPHPGRLNGRGWRQQVRWGVLNARMLA